MSTGTGLSTAPAQRLKLPGDERRSGETPSRRYPVPRVEDVDGDRIPDLLVSSGAEAKARVHVLRGAGEGRFLEPREIPLGCLGLGRIPKEGKKQKSEERAEETDVRGLAYFGDIDGDGTAEAITKVELDTGKGDMKQAKEPEYRFRFHRVQNGSVVAQPYQEIVVVGHPFSGEWPDVSNVGFADLDGDGRKDLVTVTLDFSVLQIVRVLATKRITVGLDFHVWAQGPDGRFDEVKGLDLSEKLRFDLNDLRIGRFAQFGGDFDGDGRTDFVHLGRGKAVTIHRGQPGCRYAREPDLTIQLEEEPQDLALVRVVDLDGDGRDDLSITRPLPVPEPGVSPPARLELYLSGGAR
jgi:hypothetical protein